MNETSPAPSAPQTQTPRAIALAGLIQPEWTKEQAVEFLSEGLRQLELESAALQRVIDAIERECRSQWKVALSTAEETPFDRILAIIADGKVKL